MRRDNALVADMVLAAERMADYVRGMTRESFLRDRKTQAAVEREITILGEAATEISSDVKQAHPEIPWDRLRRLRHFYVHAYELIDPNQVWATAVRTVPAALPALRKLLPEDDAS